jgi:hypothetical protein
MAYEMSRGNNAIPPLSASAGAKRAGRIMQHACPQRDRTAIAFHYCQAPRGDE